MCVVGNSRRDKYVSESSKLDCVEAQSTGEVLSSLQAHFLGFWAV